MKRQKNKPTNAMPASATFYQTAFDRLLEGCQLIGHDWRYLYLNAMAEVHNRRPNHELLGQIYMEMWPGIESTQVFTEIKRCMEERVSVQLENRFHYPDGTVGWFSLRIQPIPEGVLILSIDLTVGKQAEQQMLQMKRLYATLSQVNQTIVRVKNREELYQSICDVAVQFGEFALAWVGLFDEESGEIRPVAANGLDVQQWPFPVMSIYGGSFQNSLTAAAVRTSQVVTSEDILTDQRGEQYRSHMQSHNYHSSAVIPFRLRGRTVGVVGLASREAGFFKAQAEAHLLEEMGLDISFALDAMQTEEERQKAERQLLFDASIVESANDAILSKDLDGIILTWNPGAERLYGYAASEVIGKSLTLILPPERSHEVHSILERIKKGEDVKHYETVRLTKAGRRVDVSLTVSPIFDQEGQIVGASSIARDITERKQVEEQLQRQNQRLAILREIDTAILAADSLESIVSAALIHIRDMIHCRRAAIGLIDPVTNEVVVFDVKTSEDTAIPKGTRVPLASFQEPFTSLSQNRPLVIEDLDQLADLPPLFQELRREGLRSACMLPLISQGSPIGAFNMSSDIPGFFNEEKINLGYEVAHQVAIAITHRRLIEGLRESEEKYRAFFENNLDAILLASAEGSIQAANPAACQMFGRTEAEICALTRDQLVDQNDPRLARMLEERTQTGKTFGELTMFRRDGSPFPVELSSVLFTDHQGKTRMSLLIRDITEKKQAEERVQRQLKYLNALRMIDRAISSSFNLEVVLDVLLQQVLVQLEVDASAILLFNTQLQTLEYASSRGFHSQALWHTHLQLGEGYASQAVLARRTIHISSLMTNESRLAQALERAQEEFVDYYGAPLIVKGEVKGVLEIYRRTHLMVDPAWLDFLETLAGQAAIAIDNAQLFESLEKSNTTLERRVVERTLELNQINTELEHANRAKDEFLAMMSHELRTPLTSILGLSEALLEQKRDPLTVYQKKSLEIIESSGQHLLELINDILDLSKIEAGKFDFYPQPVAIDDICRSSLSFVRAQAAKKSIKLLYNNEATIAKIYADPRRLKQILVNLLINAVKFTSENGEVILDVKNEIELDLIHFSVIDNGIGITPQDLRRLFQPFVQVDSSLNRQYEGTGLGLALTQKLTDLHGGSIEVESEVGKGSRFTVNLASKQDEIVRSEKVEPPVLPATAFGSQPEVFVKDPTSHPQILLADDNMPNILTIGEYLEAHGYEVVTAHDGLEAIEKAKTFQPDLILMDIQMPSMNGLDAMAQLKANPQFEHIPIIALTALAMPGDRERSLSAGANEYMSKPVRLKALREMIEQLLLGKR